MTESLLEDQVALVNEQYKSILKIATNSLGWALYAQRHFEPGELVMTSRAISISPNRDAHSVQTGWNEHSTIDLPARFINHCCDANVGILDNEYGAFDFFAIKMIEQGDELLWDYEASEWEISAFSKCLCGSARCRQVLRGFKSDGDSIRTWYGHYYAGYLKTIPDNT